MNFFPKNDFSSVLHLIHRRKDIYTYCIHMSNVVILILSCIKKNTTRCHLLPLKFAYLLWTQMINIDPYTYIYIYIYLYELYILLSTTPIRLT